MRRLKSVCTALLVVALLAATAGCRQKYRPNPAATIDEPEELASSIEVGDPRADAQLLYGFHASEGQHWRWTMKKFAVSLRPPPGGPLLGARLEMRFTLLDAVAEKLKDLSITATVNGRRLAPFHVTHPGDQKYSMLVPKRVLAGDAVTVEFELSRAVPPGEIDGRELGLVVTSIGFAEP